MLIMILSNSIDEHLYFCVLIILYLKGNKVVFKMNKKYFK